MTNKEYQERYRNRHREEIRIRQKKWILDNRERYDNKRLKYYKKNKERKKKLDKIYKDKNKKEILLKEKKRYKKNRKRILETVKRYSIANKNRIREYKRKYSKLNRKKISHFQNEWQKKRVKTDPLFKLIKTLRGRLLHYLRSKKLSKKHRFVEYIECSPQELKQYLENQFIDSMSWDNHGKWHIDHITPLSSAKTEEEIYKLCHYKNLQPLWAKDNLEKGNKIIKEI